MSKVKLMYAVVAASFVAFLVEVVSGFALWLTLANGSGGGRGRGGGFGGETFIFDRHTWLHIHDWFAVVLVLLIAVHVAVHWKWIVRTTRTLFRGSRGSTVASQESIVGSRESTVIASRRRGSLRNE